ncbi:DUF3667 domain-containing protein [Limnovirga soli]|uniref:DUF3667 domain-containing protein n=1 Tax=Limnovirga soli TaxID=2656915 RepID=A0A8J8JT17_9BACT|nr:DUF3667 domain-containing protein [Limnovirga soli]NNV54169.1 DUF3667 domain-containing protein [Limnovirga soli]
MSHLIERKEKNCLNCNAEVQGRFCHICGQENVEIEESFFALATHLVYDIFHFDGKFFSSLKYLLWKPGFLTREYMRGKRATYLHPIRMYVFTSAIFFIIFFSYIVKPEQLSEQIAESKDHIELPVQKLRDSLAVTTDSAERENLKKAIAALDKLSGPIIQSRESADADSLESKYHTDELNSPKVSIVNLSDSGLPATIEIYDSIQKQLPSGKRDGWFKALLNKKSIAVNQKYEGNSNAFWEKFIEKVTHSIPQMMFVSLPLVALVLQLLYVGRRKQYFYVDHLILVVHIYIATFILSLLIFAFKGLYGFSHWQLFSWISNIIIAYAILYTYLSMKLFYKQGYFKTAFKFFLLLLICGILNCFIALIFFINSLFQV